MDTLNAIVQVGVLVAGTTIIVILLFLWATMVFSMIDYILSKLFKWWV